MLFCFAPTTLGFLLLLRQEETQAHFQFNTLTFAVAVARNSPAKYHGGYLPHGFKDFSQSQLLLKPSPSPQIQIQTSLSIVNNLYLPSFIFLLSIYHFVIFFLLYLLYCLLPKLECRTVNVWLVYLNDSQLLLGP